jgi:hypothetical protein
LLYLEVLDKRDKLISSYATVPDGFDLWGW